MLSTDFASIAMMETVESFINQWLYKPHYKRFLYLKCFLTLCLNRGACEQLPDQAEFSGDGFFLFLF